MLSQTPIKYGPLISETRVSLYSLKVIVIDNQNLSFVAASKPTSNKKNGGS